MGDEGGTIEEGGGMLVMTHAIVNPALSSGGAIEEIRASTTGARAEVVGADGEDTKTTWVDEGGRAIGSETLAATI